MVEVLEVEHLQVGPAGPGVGVVTEPVDDLGGRPGQPVLAELVHVATDGVARRRTSASSRPQHSTRALEYTSDPGSRPASAQASHPAELLRREADRLERDVELVGEPGRQGGVRRRPLPPTSTGGRGDCTGLGSAGESVSR